MTRRSDIFLKDEVKLDFPVHLLAPLLNNVLEMK